jgi:hypothetical protein
VTDDLAATLAGIRERYRRCGNSPDIHVNLETWIDSANDVPRLLKAVEAALKSHQRIDRGGPDLRPVCSCSRVLWPCPEIADITSSLLPATAGEGMTDAAT